MGSTIEQPLVDFRLRALDSPPEFSYTRGIQRVSCDGETMTTIIQADQTEIDIRDGSWRLYPSGPDVLSRIAVFKATRGSGVIEYDPEFGGRMACRVLCSP